MRALIAITLVALTVLSLAAGSVPAAKPEDVGLSSERLKRIGEAVQRHIDANNVAGAVTLVARRGRIAHIEARGMPVSRFIPEFKGLDKVAVAKPGAPTATEGGERAYDLVPVSRPTTIADPSIRWG